MKITWRGFFKFILLCLAIAAFIYLMYILFLRIKTATDTILFMPIIIKSAVVTCVVAGTAAVLFVFGTICVAVYKLMTSPKVTNEQTDVNEQTVTLNDVIVADNIRQELEKIRDSLSREGREELKKLNCNGSRHYILHGPPGNGKALIASAIANETNSSFLSINGYALADNYVFSARLDLADIFKKERKKSPCIVFIDGIDAIPQHSRDGRFTQKSLLDKIDILKKSRGDVTVIASASSMDALDQQWMKHGYFSKKIYIPQPDVSLREKALNIHMKEKQDVNLEEITKKTEGFSLRRLFILVNEAKHNALARAKEANREVSISMIDFENVLADKHNNTPVKPDRIAKVTLDDVAVSDDVRRELRKICKLQSKREIEIDEKLNYAQDTGYIFYGPPGTGKTLLAKAIANETKFSFISVSASEFIQQYVGTGPENIRKLFEEARKNAPCIVFIDEIDSIGEKRCDGSSYGHRACTETLNQLLTELDGFKSREGVIVIAATNRMDVLDSALIRGGRLSKHINIPLPDENLREKILNLYMKDTPRTEDLDLTELAGRTKGFSGADLFNLVNSVKDFARNRIVKEDTEEIVITMNDVSNALEELKDKFQKPENEEANVGNLLQNLLSTVQRSSNGLIGA